MMITEMIQEELQAVSQMQKTLLGSIRESYEKKMEHKMLSKHFYAIKNLYKANLE